MAEENFAIKVKGKVLDLKPDIVGFYTETFNLVSVIVKLTPDAPEVISERMQTMYRRPSNDFKMSLPQLEKLYTDYKDDKHLQIRARKKIDIYDIKRVLDKVRRDLLFFLAVLEDPKKSYDILMEDKE